MPQVVLLKYESKSSESVKMRIRELEAITGVEHPSLMEYVLKLELHQVLGLNIAKE